MSDHPKLKITWEEVRQADAVSPPPVPIQALPGQAPDAPLAMIWPWLAGGAGVLFLILILVALVSKGGVGGGWGGQTVEAWIKQERPQWNVEMSTSANVKEFIESMHPFVTYKRAEISDMRAVTIDGSTNAGRGGENISEVDFLVTFYWEGPVTKDGFTEVRFNYDYRGRQLKTRHFERSNALINLETVDWFKVGVTLGELLF
ncbi:MAG: hypothetical protein NTX27_22185 [Verrucomicrobia bacterium]|nr:hypothetical protein [Verrucomicrobiota bacterium]